MRQRIEELVPNAGERILLTTFHSFAGDVLPAWTFDWLTTGLHNSRPGC
jgi:hypothetical protein